MEKCRWTRTIKYLHTIYSRPLKYTDFGYSHGPIIWIFKIKSLCCIMKRYCYRSIHLMNNPPDVFMIWCFSVSVFFYPLITQTYTINFDCHAWQGFRAFLVFTGTNLSSMAQHTHYTERLGRLRGLAVACCTTDPYHPCSNPGVGISEGCFVFHFVSLPLEVARPI